MTNDDDIRNIIRKSYSEILKREPDELGMSYYLTQLKEGKIKPEDLTEILANKNIIS
ncbi:MAG: DUF4214 domain-containing protein [Nitrosotalea sp.]